MAESGSHRHIGLLAADTVGKAADEDVNKTDPGVLNIERPTRYHVVRTLNAKQIGPS